MGFVTQHGKESLVAPHLEPAIGCVVERVDGIDTDQFGTFTREIARRGTQVEAARRKAMAAFEEGDWPVRHTGSLPCERCGTSTHLPRLQVWGCSVCGYEVQQPISNQLFAPAANCPVCNP